jgi:sucrose-6-phosphate hydrolase SacC (GH32 family)
LFRLLVFIGTTAILFLVFAAGCDDAPVESTAPATLNCDPDAPSFFLMSKLDDDDGDGNPFDEDFPRIDDEDDDIADHTWIRDANGLYHLYFHNEGQGTPNEIEHYTSTNLQDLDYVGLALRAVPGSWDSGGLWAPHIVRSGDTYFMFYTGTTGPGVDPATVQAIGLATSTDLVTWTRYPANNCPGTSGDGCLYECNEDWTMWGASPGDYNQQCRDPFVIWDSANQRWVLFAMAKSTNQYGVVTVSYSTNLTDWAGAGFIDATRRLATGVGGQTTGGQAENPHVMSYNGTHYLLFTDWQDTEDSVSVQDPRTIAQYATSPVLTADTLGSVNWTYRGYIPDPAVNAIEVFRLGSDTWIMSQSIANQRSGFWTLRRRLRFKCVVWGDDFNFETSNVKFR